MLCVLIMTLLIFYSSQHDTELSTHCSTHTTDRSDGYRAGKGHFNQAGNKSIDDKRIDHMLDEDNYEEITVEDPVVSFPPKPPKRPPKKPASKQAVDITRNAQQNRSKQPVMPTLVMPHAHVQGQPAQYLPDSIYEDPD